MNNFIRRIFWLGTLVLVAASLIASTTPLVANTTSLSDHNDFRRTSTPTSTPPPTATLQSTTTPQPTPTAQSTATPTPTTAPLMITTSSMPNGNVCANYSNFITANKNTGGTLDTWKIVSGRLPDGLKMAQSFGIMSTVVSGTPTTVQTSTFTVQVQDSAGETATKTLSIEIDLPLPLVITNQSSTLASGTVGTKYSASLFTSGGCLPLVWSLTAGQLPPGLALTQNSTGQDNNVISGTPTTAGTFTFTATVTSQDGQHASMQFSITVS